MVFVPRAVGKVPLLHSSSRVSEFAIRKNIVDTTKKIIVYGVQIMQTNPFKRHAATALVSQARLDTGCCPKTNGRRI